MAMPQPLTNLQVEILKLYSTKMNEKELKELKEVLAKHYAQKAIEQADDIWEKNNLSDDDMEKWLNGN